MVGLGGSVDRAQALAVGLNCYLVIFCMYVFRGFHPTLGGAVVSALIIGPMVSSPCVGRNVPWGSARMLAASLCCGRGGAPGGRGWVSVVSSLSVGGWCGRGLLCIGFALCILVLVLFGGWWQRSFFPISLGNASICYQFYLIYCNFKFVILFI